MRINLRARRFLQEVSTHAFIRYQLRWAISAELFGAFDAFGGLAAKLCQLTSTPFLDVAETGWGDLAYRLAVCMVRHEAANRGSRVLLNTSRCYLPVIGVSPTN